MEFPIQLSRTKVSVWHWITPGQKYTRCATSLYSDFERTVLLDKRAFLEWLEKSPEEYMDEINERVMNDRSSMIWLSYSDTIYHRDSKSVCSLCFHKLIRCYCKQQQKERKMVIDHTKPIIVCSDGSIHQPEGKTISEAKQKAKTLLDANNTLTATIYAPHTKVARPMPPIKMTRIKWD